MDGKKAPRTGCDNMAGIARRTRAPTTARISRHRGTGRNCTRVLTYLPDFSIVWNTLLGWACGMSLAPAQALGSACDPAARV